MHREHVLIASLALVACARPSPAPRDAVPSPPPTAAEIARSTAPGEPPAPGPSPPLAPPRDAGGEAKAPRPLRTSPHARVSTRCVRPLSAHCGAPGRASCPTYDAALAAALASRSDGAPEDCTGLGGGDVAVGTCGRTRFVEDGDCLSGMTRFFDEKGRLVGVYAWTDVKRPCGPATIYGVVPDCAPP